MSAAAAEGWYCLECRCGAYGEGGLRTDISHLPGCSASSVKQTTGTWIVWRMKRDHMAAQMEKARTEYERVKHALEQWDEQQPEDTKGGGGGQQTGH